ncbi:hypothetical protein HJFPF1_06790 [Paramyrothecium foliicola]|nr:hypothetical protein HJFPF1_06790 [Paramyrothecium foliicola]
MDSYRLTKVAKEKADAEAARVAKEQDDAEKKAKAARKQELKRRRAQAVDSVILDRIHQMAMIGDNELCNHAWDRHRHELSTPPCAIAEPIHNAPDEHSLASLSDVLRKAMRQIQIDVEKLGKLGDRLEAAPDDVPPDEVSTYVPMHVARKVGWEVDDVEESQETQKAIYHM